VARQRAVTDWEEPESQGLGVRLLEDQITISDWRANDGMVCRLNGKRERTAISSRWARNDRAVDRQHEWRAGGGPWGSADLDKDGFR
jgi:hypothetical protein